MSSVTNGVDRELYAEVISQRNTFASEVANLRADLAAAREALRLFLPYGCPACHGDCSAANPPVMLCPMQAADAALAKGGGDE